ncbi:MAG: hypothetical protein L3J53_03635 [Proteobacteria bacterium]|nr:hypothetical protein [Pseudomonadota bacterium]
MKTTKIILIILIGILFSYVSYSQETGIPTKALNLSTLASDLGASLAKKEIPGMTEADVKAALNNKSATAKQLAMVFPEGQERNDMEKLYNVSLFAHQQSEAMLGITKGDIYGALAAYLYGNWSSCNNGQTIPDESLVNMVNNVRRLLQPVMDEKFNSSSEAEIKLAYEEFAIVGNWMLIMQAHLRQNPNPQFSESLKSLATQYLRNLQIDPEQINFTQEGDVVLSR